MNANKKRDHISIETESWPSGREPSNLYETRGKKGIEEPR